MSPAPVFPTLPGITWPVKRAPGFANTMQAALTGRRTVVRHQVAPRWSYEVEVEFLRSDVGFTEFTSLLSLFLSCNGTYGTFLFADADDNTVTGQNVGIGDGVTTQFALVRVYAGFVERIAALNGAPSISVDGVVATNYSIDSAGVVTFDAPPSAGAVISWSGAFYWVCRFDDDQLDLSKFVANFWQVKSLKFSTEIVTGVVGDSVFRPGLIADFSNPSNSGLWVVIGAA